VAEVIRECETRLEQGSVTAGCAAIPVIRVRRTCTHGHTRDGWMCTRCIAVVRMACLTCHERDGHECPVTITPLAGAA
jgi:hypothetical protein